MVQTVQIIDRQHGYVPRMFNFLCISLLFPGHHRLDYFICFNLPLTLGLFHKPQCQIKSQWTIPNMPNLSLKTLVNCHLVFFPCCVFIPIFCARMTLMLPEGMCCHFYRSPYRFQDAFVNAIQGEFKYLFPSLISSHPP